VSSDTNHYIDITAEVCPLTFVKTKLIIEKMKPGETLEIRLQGKEPLRNVPRSVAELGHAIISMIPETALEPDAHGIHRLRIRKEH
jgi:TusA-related sulfurtransferase